MINFRTINKEEPFKICFVCLGNICRSPTAEGVFQRIVTENELDSYFEVDSAGTSAYHIGESANSKSRLIAKKYGTELLSKARRFEAVDLEQYDLIVAMDFQNLQTLKALDEAREHHNKIVTLREYDPEPDDGEVPDPYFGGIYGFENVYEIIRRSSENLLEQLRPFIRDKS
ncbi:MAG: low molecular weight protein-tyrosine-phosphatase [Balneolales bacterium]